MLTSFTLAQFHDPGSSANVEACTYSSPAAFTCHTVFTTESTPKNRAESDKETRVSRGGEVEGVLKHVGGPDNEG